MIFSPELLPLVLAGRKTVTRRRYRAGRDCGYREVHTYAVQPGRGKAALARVRVCSVRLISVGEIDKADADAEGFASPAAFWEWWEGHYGDIRGQRCWRIEFELVEA